MRRTPRVPSLLRRIAEAIHETRHSKLFSAGRRVVGTFDQIFVSGEGDVLHKSSVRISCTGDVSVSVRKSTSACAGEEDHQNAAENKR